MMFPEEGVDDVSTRELMALAFKCDDDTVKRFAIVGVLM
jgi:hypothetical protein